MINKNITEDLVIDRLIKDTINSQSYLWSKKTLLTHSVYVYTYKINDTIDIIFKLFEYKQDYSIDTLIVNLQKCNGNKNIILLTSNDSRLKELIKTIEDTKCFYKS